MRTNGGKRITDAACERRDTHPRARLGDKLRVRGQECVAQRALRIRGIVHTLGQILMKMRRTVRRRILPSVPVEHGVVIRYRVILQFATLSISLGASAHRSRTELLALSAGAASFVKLLTHRPRKVSKVRRN